MAATDAIAPPATPTVDVSRPASRLARNITFLAGGQLATWGLSLLWTIFVPRALGPRGLGELTIAYAVTGVVSVVISLGIGTLMVKEIARDHQKTPWLVGTAMLVRAAFVVPSIAVVGLYIHFARSGGEQALVLWLAAASMTLALFTGPFQAAFQGHERMEYLVYGDVLTKAVVSVASIALVLIGFGVVAVMAVGLVVAAMVMLLNAWWSRNMFGLDWHITRDRVRFLVIGSLPYWMTGLVLTFYLWVDSVMLSLMSSDVVVGWYAVPTKLFSTLLFVPVILATAWLPRLSAAFRDGVDPLRRVGKPALELVLVLSLPVAIGTAMIAKPLIADIYGAAFAPSVWVLIFLALTLPPTYFNIIANQVLIAANRQLDWTKVMVGAAVINPILNLFLIRYFQSSQLHNGAIGAAISLLATEVGMALVGLLLLPRILDSRSVLRLVRAVTATLGMAAAVWAANRFGLIIEIGVGAITFAVLALVLRLLTSDEIALLRATAERVAGRRFARGAR
jgi:O-antigen/teichoic acid export membrane protein